MCSLTKLSLIMCSLFTKCDCSQPGAHFLILQFVFVVFVALLFIFFFFLVIISVSKLFVHTGNYSCYQFFRNSMCKRAVNYKQRDNLTPFRTHTHAHKHISEIWSAVYSLIYLYFFFRLCFRFVFLRIEIWTDTQDLLPLQ